MKLNKIASAIAIIGFGLCSAAWSQVIDASANLVIDQAYAPPVAANPLATPPTLAVPAVPLLVTATPLANPTADPAVGTTRLDVAGTNGSQATSVFTTPNVNFGSATKNPLQGTVGGPGGVSGLGVDVTKTTSGYIVGTVISASVAKPLAVSAGSILGGTTYTADTVLTANVTSVLGDQLVQVSRVGTGIKGTDHDFATKVTSGNTGSVGLCTYCHTPHKASSTLLLWNKTMSTNTFKWDVAATTAGTALPGFSGSTYSGPSAKCLACHDGSVAIGDIGWFAGAGRTGSAAANMNAKTMYDVSDRFVMGPDGQLGTNAAYKVALGASAKFGGSAVHPVAIPYPLNGAPNVYNGSVTGARLATADFVADPTGNNIRLYTDVGGGSIVGKVTPGKTGIECSSCHDVHNKAATDKYFLRGKMVGSSLADGYICAQCHTK